MKILVIVPAYNEEYNIGHVINDLRDIFPEGDILVVDDGSVDGTFGIARGLGAKVVSLPFNLGIGGAVQTGYRYGVLYYYDMSIQFDGDGQHRASEIKKIIEPIMNNEAELVIGSRFIVKSGYVGRPIRRMGISFFSFLLYITANVNIKDPTSGFRAVDKKTMAFFSEQYPDDYPEVESIALLKKSGFRIKEVPAAMTHRMGGKSSITFLASLYYMIKVSLAILINRLKKG